jgi:4-coumarate--CoA ligase
MFGVMWATGIVTTANPTYTVEELTRQLRDCRAKAIATTPELLPVTRRAAANARIPEDRIIVLGSKRAEGVAHWRDVVASPGVVVKRRPVDVNRDIALLVYSSGTTGKPKGVMLSHRNLTSNVLQVIASEDGNMSRDKDRVMGFLPIAHIYGLMCECLSRSCKFAVTRALMCCPDLPTRQVSSYRASTMVHLS